MNSEQKDTILPDWISQLKSQTWQIEILIAGSTIYTLLTLTDSLQTLFYKVYPGIDFTIERTLALFGIYIISRVLLIGFIANLIIRAVWLAYLGINFTFPAGVNFERLKNNPESKEILKKQPTILHRVTLLERLAKLSYSLAILIAIFITSVFISTIVIHVIFKWLGFTDLIYEAWFSYTVAIVVAIIQFGVLDRIVLSKKSKYRYINRLKKGVSTFLEYFTLSFLFRREFLAIKSNTNRWALAIPTIIILFLATVITSYQIGKYWPFGTWKMKFLDDRQYFNLDYSPEMSIYDYDANITKDVSVLRASISDQVVKGRYLKLFVTSWEQFDNKIKHGLDKFEYPLDYLSKDEEDFFKTKERADSIFNLVINDLFIVDIDRAPQENLRWKITNHPISKTKGYLTLIDIGSLDRTEHLLSLHVNFLNSQNKISKKRWKHIYFWKE
jgi:hypothetical protein